MVTGESDAERRHERRLRGLYEAIDQATPDSFYVHLDILREGKQQPPAKPLVGQLERWLAGLDLEQTAAQAQDASTFEELPALDCDADDWQLRFHAIPVAANRRGKLTGPMLGVPPAQTEVLDPTAAMRKAMRVKSSRYGDSEPLVIALALEQLVVDEEDVASALYGTTVSRVEGNPPVVSSTFRKTDGAFAPAKSRVCAVLTVATPRPWLAGRLQPRLWLNPWSDRPYQQDRLWDWRDYEPGEQEVCMGSAGVSTGELLDLSEDWPPGPPFPKPPAE